MINKTNKVIISLFVFGIVFLGAFSISINTSKAFNISNPLDPFCLFSCDSNPPTVKNITNNNINSNNSTVNIGGVPTAYAQSYTYPSLNAQCYPVQTTGSVNGVINWRASVTGGNGNYSYSWSGTDGLSGSGSSVDMLYSNPGTKTASVTIVSNGQTISRSCSSVVINDNTRYYNNDNYYYNNNNYNNYYYNNSPLIVSCRADRTTVNPGSSVTWYASVSGGNGSYTYSWSGNDNLYGYQSYVNKFYDIAGQKYANLIVYSGNQQVAVQCTNSVYVSYTDYYYNNNTGSYNYYYPSVVYPSYYPANTVNTTNNIQLACFASDTETKTGDPVTWSVESTGGYVSSYAWKGSEGLTSNQSSVVISYLLPGTKTASVTAYTTNGQTISKSCSNKVIVSDQYAKSSTKKSNYVTKKPIDNSSSIVKSNTNKNVNENPNEKISVSSLLSLNNVPWAWVAVLMIIVLLIMVIYLVINKSKL
jgi:hypothetical protein